MRFPGILCSAAAVLAACSTADKSPPRSTSTTAPVSSAIGPAPLPACPGTGHWEPCTVFDRLERAGLAPQRGDSIRVPFLRVIGQTWRLGRATIHVFRYRDSVARRADFITLDSARAKPGSDTLARWIGPPTLLVNDNLLAILLSDNAQQIERVSLALTAGPAPKPVPAAPQ
jgi:hypothetical protein